MKDVADLSQDINIKAQPQAYAAPALAGERVKFNPTGLDIADDLQFDEWESLVNTLRQTEKSVMWWIGDALRFGERKYGEMYSQAVDATGYSTSALRNAKWVAEKYDERSRRQDLSFKHHAEAASRDDRNEVLERAENEGWSTRDLRSHLSKMKNRVGISPTLETGQVQDLHEAVSAGVKFGTIYADPPWIYDNQGTRAATGNHYEGLTVEQLCELPVGELAADDAHLHLWTTNAFLFDCPKIFDAWGFEFRSSFVWCKPQMGIGNYWRNSHEILLTAIRGDSKRFNDHSMMSWLESDRGRHSAKPEKVRHFIERASEGPYLEMFARSKVEGWKVWGNEVSDCLFTRGQA